MLKTQGDNRYQLNSPIRFLPRNMAEKYSLSRGMAEKHSCFLDEEKQSSRNENKRHCCHAPLNFCEVRSEIITSYNSSAVHPRIGQREDVFQEPVFFLFSIRDVSLRLHVAPTPNAHTQKNVLPTQPCLPGLQIGDHMLHSCTIFLRNRRSAP